jgi:hypothetical protein
MLRCLYASNHNFSAGRTSRAIAPGGVSCSRQHGEADSKPPGRPRSKQKAPEVQDGSPAGDFKASIVWYSDNEKTLLERRSEWPGS